MSLFIEFIRSIFIPFGLPWSSPSAPPPASPLVASPVSPPASPQSKILSSSPSSPPPPTPPNSPVLQGNCGRHQKIGGPKYVYVKNAMIKNMPYYSVANADRCEDACDVDPQCTAYTCNGVTCRLHSDPENSGFFNTRTSLTRTHPGTRSFVAYKMQNSNVHGGHKLQGVEMRTIPNNGDDVCVSECLKDSDCKGVNMAPSECTLLSKITGLGSVRHNTAFVK